jgi:3-oxoacyl-[acyl-carrier protein] reductase
MTTLPRKVRSSAWQRTGKRTRRGDGIYINCAAPGWVETELVAPALNDRGNRRRVEGEIPLGRLGKPEDIAVGILFLLCTEHAGFVTGEVLNINGGEALVG